MAMYMIILLKPPCYFQRECTIIKRIVKIPCGNSSTVHPFHFGCCCCCCSSLSGRSILSNWGSPPVRMNQRKCARCRYHGWKLRFGGWVGSIIGRKFGGSPYAWCFLGCWDVGCQFCSRNVYVTVHVSIVQSEIKKQRGILYNWVVAEVFIQHDVGDCPNRYSCIYL